MKMDSTLTRRLGIVSYVLLIAFLLWQCFGSEGDFAGEPFIGAFTFPISTGLFVTLFSGGVAIIFTGPLLVLYLACLSFAGYFLMQIFEKRWWLGIVLVLPVLLALCARQVAVMYYDGYYVRFHEVRTAQECDAKNLNLLSHAICVKVAQRLSWEETDPRACDAAPNDDYEYCIRKIAAHQKDVTICNKLSKNTLSGPWGYSSYENCVIDIAQVTGDQKICDLIDTTDLAARAPNCIQLAKIGLCDYHCTTKAAVAAKDIHKCDALLDPQLYDNQEYGFCAAHVAQATLNPKYCNLPTNSQISQTDRALCLGSLAHALHNPKVCNTLKIPKYYQVCLTSQMMY